MSRRRLLVAGLLLLTGCGTTVPADRMATGGSSVLGAETLVELPADAPATATAEGSMGGLGIPGVDDAAPRDKASARESGTAGRPSTSPRGAAAAEPGSIPGVTDRTVKIGVLYGENGGALLTALGGSSGDVYADGKRTYQAVIDEANRRGGLFGREIVPVYVAVDASGDQATQAEAACETFTRDNRVYAAVGAGTPAFYACMNKAGVAVVSAASGLDAAALRGLPLTVAPGTPTIDRSSAAYVPALAGGGYFTGWNATTGSASNTPPRIGVLTFSDATYHRVTESVLLPALRRYDKAPVVQEVTLPYSVSDAPKVANDMQSAVLRFKAAGVDHVVMLLIGGTSESIFINQADRQQYRPRYAFTSDDSIQAVVQLGLIMDPERQLAGAVGVGWQPVADVPYSGSPFLRSGAAARCLAVAAEAGITVSDPVSAALIVQACDYIWLLQAAAGRREAMSAKALVEGVGRLGRSYASPQTQRTSFIGHRDGAAGFQLMGYGQECSCISYRSGVQDFRS